MNKIIKTKYVIDGTGGNSIKNGAITIDDGIIESVTIEPSLSDYAEADVIDASDKTALPGLIDGHVHVAWGTEEKPG